MALSYLPLQDVQTGVVKYSRCVPGMRWEYEPVISRGHYGLIWVVDGPESLTTEVDGRVLSLPTGSLLLLRPGLAWTLENRPDGTRSATLAELWVTFRKLPRGWPPPATWPVTLTPPVDSAIFPVFRFALTLASCNEPERTILGQTVFQLLLLMLLTGRNAQHHPQAIDLPPSLERVWQTINQSGYIPGKRLRRVDELAKDVGMSVGHLTVLFTRHMGISPGEFMQSQRLEHAASLLTGSRLSIKELANLTGFCSQFHFCRQFRKRFGCAPTFYRNMPQERRPTVKVLERLKIPIPELLQFPTYASADILARIGGAKATTARLLQEVRRELAANRTSFKFPTAARGRWLPLSLAPFANRSRQDDSCSLFGPSTRNPHLPVRKLHAHGIPFVLPEERRGAKGAILLQSSRLQEQHLPESVTLPVNGRTAGIGLLHACAWTTDQHIQLGEYEIVYTDSRSLHLPVMTWGGPKSGAPKPRMDTPHPVLQDYWPLAFQVETRTSRKVMVTDPEHPLASINYLYVFWWENPRPDQPVRHLRLHGSPASIGLWAVLGVTLLRFPG